jgi:hypothetical protein
MNETKCNYFDSRKQLSCQCCPAANHEPVSQVCIEIILNIIKIYFHLLAFINADIVSVNTKTQQIPTSDTHRCFFPQAMKSVGLQTKHSRSIISTWRWKWWTPYCSIHMNVVSNTRHWWRCYCVGNHQFSIPGTWLDPNAKILFYDFMFKSNSFHWCTERQIIAKLNDTSSINI